MGHSRFAPLILLVACGPGGGSPGPAGSPGALGLLGARGPLERGGALRVEYSLETRRDLLGLVLTVDGQASESGPTDRAEEDRRAVILDRGLPRGIPGGFDLERSFEAIDGRFRSRYDHWGKNGQQDLELTSELVGRRFGPQDSPSTAGRGEALADLSHRALLPAQEPHPGDSWPVPLDWLMTALYPCGDLGLHPVGEASALGEGPERALEGRILATYRGPFEEDGRPFGRIELSIEVQSEERWPDGVEESLWERPKGQLSRQLRGEGQVLWDLAGGHLASLRLELTGRLIERTSHLESSFEGGDHSTSTEATFACIYQLGWVARPADRD